MATAQYLPSAALVINRLTYALPAYAGQLTADDKNGINAISRKAM